MTINKWLGSIGNVEKMSLKFTFKNINRVASSTGHLELPIQQILRITVPVLLSWDRYTTAVLYSVPTESVRRLSEVMYARRLRHDVVNLRAVSWMW